MRKSTQVPHYSHQSRHENGQISLITQPIHISPGLMSNCAETCWFINDSHLPDITARMRHSSWTLAASDHQKYMLRSPSFSCFPWELNRVIYHMLVLFLHWFVFEKSGNCNWISFIYYLKVCFHISDQSSGDLSAVHWVTSYDNCTCKWKIIFILPFFSNISRLILAHEALP